MILREEITSMKERLEKKEAEHSAIRKGNAIKDRDQPIAKMGVSGPRAAKEHDELLEACQEELAKHQTRADDAEV